MVKYRGRKFERIGARYWSCLGILLVLLVLLVLGVLYSLSRSDNGLARITLAIASDPVVLLSWNRSSGQFILVEIPADTVIEGVYGYGKYSLEALWRLGDIRKEDHKLLTKSLEQVLGIPVSYYLGIDKGVLPVNPDSIDTARQLFSYRRILAHAFGAGRWDMPLSVFMQLAWRVHFSRADAFQAIRFSDTNALVDETLADGQQVRVLHPQRADPIIGNLFEDEAIRRERIRVAVYNTTQIAAMADGVARLLQHMGVFVVFVGNDNRQITQCEVNGRKEALATKTARMIVTLLGCSRAEKTDVDRADLIVYIGSDQAKETNWGL